jgi:choline-sulfatase
MSGLPVHQTQVYNNCSIVQSAFPSYGAVLREQGVHSVHIGKTDVYNRWETLGFSDVRFAGDRASPGDVNFCRSPLTIREDGPSRANGYGPRTDAFRKDLRIVDEAVGWLSDEAPSIETPWTLTVNIVAPHFPHYATTELWDKYQGFGDLPKHGSDVESANHPYAQDLRNHFQTDAFAEEQIRGLRQGYLAGVDFVDRQLGRLIDAIEAAGMRDDTVIVYTSDHGEMLGTFGMWWKCSTYEDSLRVPLIVAGPGFEHGIRSVTPVSLLDLQASTFRATGTTRPDHWWGEPLQDVAPHDPERVVLAEYHGHGTRSGSFVIRKGEWKLHYHDKAPHQLFHLASDPDELRNRFDDDPETVADLVRELHKLCDPQMEFERAHAFEQRQLSEIERLRV